MTHYQRVTDTQTELESDGPATPLDHLIVVTDGHTICRYRA